MTLAVRDMTAGERAAMENLHREGRIRAIGVADFHPDRLVDLIVNSDVTPAVNQIEIHPFFQRAIDHEVMREHGVQFQSRGAGSPKAATTSSLTRS